MEKRASRECKGVLFARVRLFCRNIFIRMQQMQKRNCRQQVCDTRASPKTVNYELNNFNLIIYHQLYAFQTDIYVAKLLPLVLLSEQVQ